MAAFERALDRATQRARQDLGALGREIRTARLTHDLSQRRAAERLGVSGATWSLLERGLAPETPLLRVAGALAIVGLDLHVRAYPGGDALRDGHHTRLLGRFAARLGHLARWSTEVGLPDPAIGGRGMVWWCSHEFASGWRPRHAPRDAQDLQRRLNLKRRDGGVDHVILLLADTRHDRAFLAACPDAFVAAFPVPAKRAVAMLGASVDTGGSAIILL